MKAPILIALLLPLLAAPLQAGTIMGTVHAVSPNAGSDESDGGAYQSRKYKFLDKIDYENLTDFVVSIADIEQPANAETPAPFASVSQKDGTFVPHVLPIVAGSEVEWPNRDEIYHNVFSMSSVKEFDLGMYKSTEDPKRLVFEKTGLVDVFCALHSEMHCIVLVLPNPWFDRADRKGRYKIDNVPAGKYRLKAWHERLPAKYVEIEVPEHGVVEIDIQMGFSGLPKI